MDKERIEGIGHQAMGALKENLGKIIGDAKLVIDGAAQRKAGVAQSANADHGQLAGIDTDRIIGVGRQLQGALKRGLGKVIGNPALQADGTTDQAAGKAQNAAGSTRDEIRDALELRKATMTADDKAAP